MPVRPMRLGVGIMADAQVLLASFMIILFVLILLIAAALKVVREGERLVVFRLGHAMGTRGPGLVSTIPIIDRAVRVEIPVGFVRPRVGRSDAPGMGTVARDEVPGHPDMSMGDVCLRAAILAVQRNERTKRATTEDFLAALNAVTGERTRGVW